MRIGNLKLDNNLLLAPLAGYSDRAFRVVAKRHGAGMVYTEMVSARGLIHENRATKRYLLTTPEEKPLSAQLFSAEPEAMAEAAKLVAEQGIEAVDINMGCPVRKVIKGGAGAALMQNMPQAKKIITAVRKAVSLPITVKMRSGWDSQSINHLQMGRMAEDCGADAITLHPRTARQLFTGTADWSNIRGLKETVSIPVIGNGDIRSFKDVFRMEAETGCDGVMIGRAALGNPWIFEDVLVARQGGIPQLPTPQMKLLTILVHIDLLHELYEEKVGINRFKAHILHYLKELSGVRALRHHICSKVQRIADLRESVKDFFDTYEVRGSYTGGSGWFDQEEPTALRKILSVENLRRG